MLICPPFIKKGALVGLVSPSGKIPPNVVVQAEKYLDQLGFRHVRGKHVTDAWHQFAGKDESRAADLQEMIQNPEVEVIWCTRGGYGAQRVIENVDFSILRANPKWLVGFSDITVFHSILQNVEGVMSVHGPMAKNLYNGVYNTSGMTSLWELLQGSMTQFDLEPHPLNRQGISKGILTGGNLTILNTLKGSPYDFDPTGKILFIEDVGEYLYHIDRMMQGLKLAGKLACLSGLVVGQMSELQDNNAPFGASAYEIIADAVKDYAYPVLFDFPAGHTKRNEPLLFGAKVTMQVRREKVSLTYNGSK
jgi:muramoyltetrapeptide carboxypeptidase